MIEVHFPTLSLAHSLQKCRRALAILVAALHGFLETKIGIILIDVPIIDKNMEATSGTVPSINRAHQRQNLRYGGTIDVGGHEAITACSPSRVPVWEACRSASSSNAPPEFGGGTGLWGVAVGAGRAIAR